MPTGVDQSLSFSVAPVNGSLRRKLPSGLIETDDRQHTLISVVRPADALLAALTAECYCRGVRWPWRGRSGESSGARRLRGGASRGRAWGAGS